MLAALSAFAGGFTRDVAESVAEASMRTLAALVDKSLVRRHANGRYGLHALVQQFACAQLHKTRSQEAEVVRRHADAYAALLSQWFAGAKGPDEAAAQARLRSDLANILAAWERSLESGRRDIVERMAPVLIEVLRTQARVPAALRTGEQAIAALGKNARSDVICTVRMEWGRAAVTGGQRDLGKRELEAAVELARELGNPSAIGRCLYYYVHVAISTGSSRRNRGDRRGTASARGASEDLEVTCSPATPPARSRTCRRASRGRAAHAQSSCGGAPARHAVAHRRDAVQPHRTCVLPRRLCEAAALLEEAAEIFERIGRNTFAINIRSNLGAVMLAKADLDEARENVTIAMRMARDAGDRNGCAGHSRLPPTSCWNDASLVRRARPRKKGRCSQLRSATRFQVGGALSSGDGRVARWPCRTRAAADTPACARNSRKTGSTFASRCSCSRRRNGYCHG